MDVRLGENIRAFRKKAMQTQEQLAERLNVSVGVISKWENGVSTPEIGVIMTLADIFETSVDVLLGYRSQDKTRMQIIEEIKELTRKREILPNSEQIEKYINKYPNDFDIVYLTGKLYALKGSALKKSDLKNRALYLLQKACTLIDQNTDENISYLSLQTDIAWLYRSLGRENESLELYKKHNPCGLNDDRIGILLACELNRPEEAVPYLSGAFVHNIYMLIDICVGFINIYDKRKKYSEVIEVADWMLNLIDNTVKKGKVGPLNKLSSVYSLIKANAYMYLGDTENAGTALRKAKEFALIFDASPCYDAALIRFAELENATAYDDYGDTALNGINNFLNEQNNSELIALWKEISNERV